MLGIGPLILIVVAALVFAGFYSWARRQGFLAAEPITEAEPAGGRISLLTEAVAYVGMILILAGGGAAIGQRWNDIADWGHVAIFAGAAAFFLVLGLILRRVHEPAVQRLVGVVWLLSVAGLGAAVGFAVHEVYGASGEVTALMLGIAMAVYAAVLWLVRKRGLQNLALFIGLVVTIVGAILSVPGEASSLAFALALWMFGLVWALLAWRRYLEPLWVAAPLGVILALIAPSVAVADHGWVYTIGIATAGAAMAISVPLRNAPLLALGTIAMFGYVTSTVIRYFSDSLGVPATLAITGVVILLLATVSARLLRTTRPRKPKPPITRGPSHHDLTHA